MSTRDHHETGLATGAYALDALDAEERAAFEQTLAHSEELRAEVTGLQDTAVELALAVPAEAPSTALRARLLAQIAVTTQHPPLETPASGAGGLAAEADAAAMAPVVDLAERRRGWRSVVALAAAAAAVVGGVVSLPLLPTTDAQQASAISAAPDAQVAGVELADGGTANLVWSADLGRSMVTVDGLAALTPEQRYELWYINDDGARPAGLFSAEGLHTAVLDGAMQEGDAVGITVEPAAGSEAPTTTPLFVVSSQQTSA
jgi:anti-sigma-K factor RskA